MAIKPVAARRNKLSSCAARFWNAVAIAALMSIWG
jgi:hypothetical protein